VQESRRQPEHGLRLGVQLDAVPLAEGGRALADVHRDVEDLPANHGDELAHARLHVEAAEDAELRVGVIVLKMLFVFTSKSSHKCTGLDAYFQAYAYACLV
jgi:hypothetical protein